MVLKTENSDDEISLAEAIRRLFAPFGGVEPPIKFPGDPEEDA